MDFPHFSGVFGVYDRTTAIEAGASGLADKNFSIPNNPAFSYQTASGTKGFTAVALLSLVAGGQVGLDDCAKRILTSCPDSQKYGSIEWLSDDVTLRSLLNHTSGVPDYFDEDYIDDFEAALCGGANYRYEKPEQFFPLMEAAWKKQETPYAAAGSFKYSNGAFVILAAVVEAVSGESFPNFVAGHVFKPFGMGRSGFFRLDERAPDGIVKASAYQKNGRSNIYAVPVIGGGDGGAYTNPQDMARFWTGLDPELNAQSLLAPLVEEAWTVGQDGDDGLYGLGFWMRKEAPRIVFLEGFDPGVQFFSYYNRDTKRSLTICLNDEVAGCGEVFERYFPMVE
ncbi:MAG: serine hydrolase [Treponema sp.]|nr:serine hydrolase [Treponema sp.]